MSRICELHDEAMDIMNEAIALQSDGREEESRVLFARACDLESESANLVEKKPENEPSRSMLFLGAASLAWRAKEYERAERLACDGLSGYPTERTKLELRKLHEQIKFDLLARETSPVLNEAETEIRFLEGGGVGYGRIVTRALLQRLDALERMISRTIQRKSGLPFESHPKKHTDFPEYQLDFEGAPAGSFGMKLRLTQKGQQQFSLLAPTPSDVLRDVIRNIELVSNGAEEEVKENIKDDDYYAHFVSQAKEILPDGIAVKRIGFIDSRKNFIIKKTKKEINSFLKEESSQNHNDNDKKNKTCIFTGYLRVSDGLKGEFQLLPDTEDKKIIKIQVRDALEELAKKYFGDMVEVSCKKSNKKYYLTDINPVQ